MSVTPTWSSLGEAFEVVLFRPHLRKTVRVAVVVGTLLFCINQLDVVLSGNATAVVWMKAALTYLVPFGVSNFGVLVATRRREDVPAGGRPAALRRPATATRSAKDKKPTRGGLQQ